MENTMKKLTILLRLIGVVQLILGAGLLFVLLVFTGWMGLSATQTDINYLFGMLAARFIAYSVGMFVIAREPEKNIFWIKNMMFIQIIDLAVGLFYTINSTLTLSVSAFPIINATIFAVLWARARQDRAVDPKIFNVSGVGQITFTPLLGGLVGAWFIQKNINY